MTHQPYEGELFAIMTNGSLAPIFSGGGGTNLSYDEDGVPCFDQGSNAVQILADIDGTPEGSDKSG